MHIAHETAGAARTRSSLRPLIFWRDTVHANLGRIVPRECEVVSGCLKCEPDIARGGALNLSRLRGRSTRS